MAGSPLHEAIWASLPDEIEPPHLELRTRFVCSEVREGDRVLDVGCGDGRIAERLLAGGAAVSGLDVAREALRRALERCPQMTPVLAPEHGDWPLEDGAFDLVWCGETLEHAPDTRALLAEMRRVLSPGGRLVLAVPDLGPLTLAAMALWPPFAGRRLDPRSDELHCFNARSLRALLVEAGFGSVRVRGAGGVVGARAQLLARAVRDA